MFLNFNVASTSEMTFEETFEALMKNYQAVSSSMVELEKQNESFESNWEMTWNRSKRLFKVQVHLFMMKMKQVTWIVLQVMRNLEEGFEVREERPKTQMISKLKFLSLRVSLIQMSSLNGYKLLSESLNTRRSRGPEGEIGYS